MKVFKCKVAHVWLLGWDGQKCRLNQKIVVVTEESLTSTAKVYSTTTECTCKVYFEKLLMNILLLIHSACFTRHDTLPPSLCALGRAWVKCLHGGFFSSISIVLWVSERKKHVVRQVLCMLIDMCIQEHDIVSCLLYLGIQKSKNHFGYVSTVLVSWI